MHNRIPIEEKDVLNVGRKDICLESVLILLQTKGKVEEEHVSNAEKRVICLKNVQVQDLIKDKAVETELALNAVKKVT